MKSSCLDAEDNHGDDDDEDGVLLTTVTNGGRYELVEWLGGGDGGGCLGLFDEVEELFTSLGVVAEDTEHLAGHCLAVDLLNASHDHAHVT